MNRSTSVYNLWSVFVAEECFHSIRIAQLSFKTKKSKSLGNILKNTFAKHMNKNVLNNKLRTASSIMMYRLIECFRTGTNRYFFFCLKWKKFMGRSSLFLVWYIFGFWHLLLVQIWTAVTLKRKEEKYENFSLHYFRGLRKHFQLTYFACLMIH